MMKNLLVTLFLVLLTTNSFSAGSDSTTTKVKSDYDKAVQSIKFAKKYEMKGKDKKALKVYKEALKYLYKANKEKPYDPDTLNYLGFTNRKVGNFKDAENFYLKGLEIDPKHNGINEYLGELYVQTDRIDKAKERLEVLKNCNCEEYGELELIIKTRGSKVY